LQNDYLRGKGAVTISDNLVGEDVADYYKSW